MWMTIVGWVTGENRKAVAAGLRDMADEIERGGNNCRSSTSEFESDWDLIKGDGQSYRDLLLAAGKTGSERMVPTQRSKAKGAGK
jgi:hypothetical protein